MGSMSQSLLIEPAICMIFSTVYLSFGPSRGYIGAMEGAYYL